MFLELDDFINKFELSKGMFVTNKLTSYIERYEKHYLVNLLGSDLYTQFMSDLDVNDMPQSPNFWNIYNPFNEDWNFRILESKGLIDMLTGFIYFEFSKDLVNQQTPFGNVDPKSENSVVASTIYNMMYNRYNESVKTYTNIQMYIYKNRHEGVGQLVFVTMTNAGTNYVAGVYDVVGGSGTGAKFEIFVDGTGTITSVSINDPGVNYQIGDQLGIDSGDSNLVVNVDYVGIGEYSKFNGQRKQYNSWV